jgi:hypothetical protein
MTSKTYSLQEAANATGMSLNRFRAHKEELVKLGAVVDSRGWSIPHEAIDRLGWLGVKPPREKGALVRVDVLKAEQAENTKLKARVKELEGEIAELNSRKGLFGRRSKK